MKIKFIAGFASIVLLSIPCFGIESLGVSELLDATGVAACAREIAQTQEKIPPFRVRYRLIEQPAGGSAKAFDCEFFYRNSLFSFVRNDLEGNLLTQLNYDGRRYYRFDGRPSQNLMMGEIAGKNLCWIEDHALSGFIGCLGPVPIHHLLNQSDAQLFILSKIEAESKVIESGLCRRCVEMSCNEDLLEATETLLLSASTGNEESVVRTIHLTLNPTMNYRVSCAEIQWGTPFQGPGSHYQSYFVNVKDYHEVRGYSLPCRAFIRLIETPKWGGKEVNITLAAAPEDFSAFDVPAGFAMKFPPGTRVADRIMNTSYVISKFASQ